MHHVIGVTMATQKHNYYSRYKLTTFSAPPITSDIPITNISDGLTNFPTDLRIFPTDLRIFPTDLQIFPTDLRLFATDLRLLATNWRLFTTDLRLFATDLRLYATDLRLFSDDLTNISHVYPKSHLHNAIFPHDCHRDVCNSARRANRDAILKSQCIVVYPG